ncbi:MAG: protein kinase, partial [Myxococcota bacterium]
MALIKCSECTQMHSDTLVSCPACGHQRERDATPMYLDDEYLQGIVLCGKYSLEELVGKGGMAHVYRARHVHFDQFVAVKLLFRHLAKEDAMQQRFLREAKIQFGLQHPNIVRVFDFVEERGLLGVVMDWVEGYTLATWSQHQDYPLPTKQVLSIMQPLCEAIFYAHCKK